VRDRFSRLLSEALNVGAVARDVIADRLPRGKPTVLLYDGYGQGGRVWVSGRALRDEKIAPSRAEDTRLQNLWAMVRRADADPVPRAVVRLTVGSVQHEARADDEGFFHEWVNAPQPERIDDEWVKVRANLLPTAGAEGSPPTEGRALVPGRAPEHLVISDVDDTVLQSKVTNLLLAARTIAFGNARTRLPFPGVAAFYHALRRGPSGTAANPLFYVSSSPWNLHDLITQFFDIQGIPQGPLMLRDLDIDLGLASSRRHHEHKRENIRRILETFAGVPVILLGDSSQQDPEIYRDVVRDFAGRVRAIYIRNVNQNTERSQAIKRLADEVLEAGSSLVLADDTLAAARHAAEHGFIAADTLSAIGEEKKADEGAKPGKVDAPGARDATDQPTPTIVVEDNAVTKDGKETGRGRA
jgi:phosphatidate phosphatase APP1